MSQMRMESCIQSFDMMRTMLLIRSMTNLESDSRLAENAYSLSSGMKAAAAKKKERPSKGVLSLSLSCVSLGCVHWDGAPGVSGSALTGDG